MKIPVSLIVIALGLAPVARAELPVSSRFCVGVGLGGGHREDLETGGPAYLLATDLAWRHGSRHSLLVSLELAHASTGIHLMSLSPRLGDVDHKAVLIGAERSRAGPGFAPYLHGGIGFGSLTTGRQASKGLALGGGLGCRLISPARELGFALGMRADMVLATRSRSFFLAPTLGVLFRPR